MVSVASLLNHELDLDQLPTPTSSTRYSSECSPAPSDRPSKKPKLAKDAAVFQKSKVTGQVRYIPYETTDSKVLQELERLNVFPLPPAKMADFPRHIPYNSDKKQLYQKTGRDAFEVFQYTFQPPGHERSYAVLWDYNIGLVRMTPFFKCCRYPKTIPSKMLNLNPGLREICHSITGGALVAQGYWVPFEAAKALASTFCWEFRYALVPVFGPEFPDLCVKPGSDTYSTMIIDEKIIQKCTQDVEMFRSMQHKLPLKHNERQATIARAETVADRKHHEPSKHYSGFRPINRSTTMPIEAPIESSYPFLNTPLRTPDSSRLSSPAMGSLNTINTPASLHQTSRLPSPNEILGNRVREVAGLSPPPNSPESSEGDVSPKTMPRKRRYFGRVPAQVDGRRELQDVNSNRILNTEADIRAAQILVDLHNAVQNARVEIDD